MKVYEPQALLGFMSPPRFNVFLNIEGSAEVQVRVAAWESEALAGAIDYIRWYEPKPPKPRWEP